MEIVPINLYLQVDVRGKRVPRVLLDHVTQVLLAGRQLRFLDRDLFEHLHVAMEVPPVAEATVIRDAVDHVAPHL
jgi:hypothetical protein